jgi:ABC-2 type transport system permease protein
VFRLLSLELRKIFQLWSVRASLTALAVLPLVVVLAADDFGQTGVVIVNAAQVAGASLVGVMQTLIYIMVAAAAAELVAGESVQGTLRTLLLRPITRASLISAKLVAAALFPFLGLGLMLLSSLVLGGISRGFGALPAGSGTVVGPGGWVGFGQTIPIAEALREVAFSYSLAAFAMIPVAFLAVLLAVITMNAGVSALGAYALIGFMGLGAFFPAIRDVLLTSHTGLWYREGGGGLGLSLGALAIYTAGLAIASVLSFDRKDL